MNPELQEALSSFEEILRELGAAQTELEAVKPMAPPGEWHLHANRLAFSRTQVAAVQLMGTKIAAAFRNVPRGTKTALSAAAMDTAINALHGGSMLLSGVIYGARQFVAQVENQHAPSAMPGLLAGINWLTIGKVISMLEKGIGK